MLNARVSPSQTRLWISCHHCTGLSCGPYYLLPRQSSKGVCIKGNSLPGVVPEETRQTPAQPPLISCLLLMPRRHAAVCVSITAQRIVRSARPMPLGCRAAWAVKPLPTMWPWLMCCGPEQPICKTGRLYPPLQGKARACRPPLSSSSKLFHTDIRYCSSFSNHPASPRKCRLTHKTSLQAQSGNCRYSAQHKVTDSPPAAFTHRRRRPSPVSDPEEHRVNPGPNLRSACLLAISLVMAGELCTRDSIAGACLIRSCAMRCASRKVLVSSLHTAPRLSPSHGKEPCSPRKEPG